MADAGNDRHQSARSRQIGGIGTAARVVLGLALLAYGVSGGQVMVIRGQVRTGFEPLGVAIGLIALPAVLLTWQWLRARRTSNRLKATGPAGTALNMLVFLALFLTPWYAPRPSRSANSWGVILLQPVNPR